jgi:small ligand-binding sensory domain FIST
MSDNSDAAFPCTGNPEWEHDPGMTLRDYFAGQALAGFVADGETNGVSDQSLAKQSYSLADAMLSAREGEPQ